MSYVNIVCHVTCQYSMSCHMSIEYVMSHVNIVCHVVCQYSSRSIIRVHAS